jgi:hypothetical protein
MSMSDICILSVSCASWMTVPAGIVVLRKGFRPVIQDAFIPPSTYRQAVKVMYTDKSRCIVLYHCTTKRYWRATKNKVES